MPSRGLFSKTRGHYVVAEKEVKAATRDRKEKKRPNLGARRDSSAGNRSEDRNQILPAVTMSDKADRVYEHAEKSGAGLTRRQKLRRHCARWWWAHLIVFLAITALVVCLM